MVQMVKKWIAEDGSEHDSKQSAEQNARFRQAVDVAGKAAEEGNVESVVLALRHAGLLNLVERKPRAKREPKADKPAKASKAKASNGAAVQ